MTMKKLETKEFPFLLTKMDDDAGTFSGYASTWGTVDSYADTVEKGAFKRTLKNKKEFPLLWSHNVDEPIGIMTAIEDDKGLLIEGHLDLNVRRAAEIRSLMKMRSVKGLSIGFRTVKESIDKDSKIRTIKEIDLWEVSPCVFQACPGAEVTDVKSQSLDDEDSEDSTPRDDKSDPGETRALELKAYADALKEIRESLFGEKQNGK
jgi:hypothetical protein